MNCGTKATGTGAARFGMALWLIAFALLPATVMAQSASATVEADQPAGMLVPPTSASDFTAVQLDSMLARS